MSEPGTDGTDDTDTWVDSTDRGTALRALAEHHAEARLTPGEHDRRRELVRTATTRGEVRVLFADLPAPHPLLGEEAAPRSRLGNGTAVLYGSGGVIVFLALAAGWWVPAIIFACVLVVVAVLTVRR
jgi:hypothetical protein